MAVISTDGRRAVFLDKDGTLLENVPYNVEPGAMRLMPGAGPALQRLAGAGYELVVVTNQSGVARGLFPERALSGVHRRLEELLEPFGVKLSAFHACPHHPQGVVPPYARQCECRKPRPGLLLQTARKLSLDLSTAWMVGDILDDVEAGCRAGCRTVLLHGPEAGGETEWLSGECREPTVVAKCLEDAANAILDSSQEPKEARCEAIHSN